METRIYIVGYGQETRLIRATHKAQALSHVAKSMISVKVASQEELVETLKKGASVENASSADQLTLVE